MQRRGGVLVVLLKRSEARVQPERCLRLLEGGVERDDALEEEERWKNS